MGSAPRDWGGGLKHGVGRCFYHAADGGQLREERGKRHLIGVERDEDMAGAGHDVERNVFGGAQGGEGGDQARPFIGLQQDDPARGGGRQG